MKNNSVAEMLSRPKGCRPISAGVAVSLTAVSAIAAGAFPSNYGGLLFLVLSVGLYFYVMTAAFSPLYIAMGAALSVAVALFCGIKFPLALTALVFIPISFSMSMAVRRRAGLSATVAVGTMTTVVLLAFIAGICYFTVREELVSALGSIWGQYEDMMRSFTSRMNSTAAGTVISDTMIEELIRATMMILPSMLVLIIMGVCYLAAKLFRLATIVSDSGEMFEGGSWHVTASLSGSVVFIASYLVTMFTFNSEIIYYSALNILYIILPAQAIVGFRLMFGKRSPVKLRHGWMRLMVIALCVYLLFSNFVMLLMLAASFAAFFNIRLWMMSVKKRMDDDDDN